MIQRREQMGLAFEAREPLGIGGKQLGQDLDGDVAPELCVARGRLRPIVTPSPRGLTIS
jgi:hypothetical protein